MSDVVIRAEGIGKSYWIGHQSENGHETLREAIVNTTRRWSSKIAGAKNPDSEKEEFWALKSVSFEVKEGERIGIIGQNGAGKSTLLKILSRITEPTTGRVAIQGRVASLLEVGTGFHPELTGRENIYLNGTILGMTRQEIKHKFDEIVDFSGIEKFLDTPVKRFSSGMYVRLAFAVAAHLEPEILIVDEVLAVGDAQFQKKCLGKMNEVGAEGRTVLFVSHNLAAIQQLCNVGILLSGGRSVFCGDVDQAISGYIDMIDRSPIYGRDGYIDLDKARDKIIRTKIFRRMRILDKNNASCRSFPMLSPVRIEVEFESGHDYPNVDFGITIFTQDGIRVTSYATWMYPGNNVRLPKKMYLDIPSLKFSPGVYRIRLSATYHSAGEWVDKVENAASFSIEGTDLFGSGRQFSNDLGLMVPEGDLRLV